MAKKAEFGPQTTIYVVILNLNSVRQWRPLRPCQGGFARARMYGVTPRLNSVPLAGRRGHSLGPTEDTLLMR